MNNNNTNMTLASDGTKTARFGNKTARLYFIAALGVALIGLAGVAILMGPGDSAAPSGGASQAETLSPLQGEAALTHLREQGQYESLAAAMETARYGVRQAAGAETFGAANERQGFHAAFTSAGLTLAAPGGSDWRLGMTLRGVGYGTADQPLGPATLSSAGQRVELLRQMPTRGSVTEWYVNRPNGLEQGFTLSEAPGERRAGEPLTLSLELSEGWRAAIEPDGQSARLSSTGGVHLQYDKLLVTDAAGRQLEARMATAGDGTVRLEVVDEGAQYPVTIDPTFTQQAYLKASNTGADDRFGISVAVSGDTVVVGAIEDSNATGVNGDQADNSSADSGAAYVFTRSGTTWTQQAYLKASNTGAGDQFGSGVAVSGNTLVVGAPAESSNATGVGGDQTNNSANGSGAAYVFTRSGTIWTQQAYLKASNTGAGDGFGISVAVSGDTVVVGAIEDSNATGVNGDQGNNSANASGAAYVFTRSGTTWSQQAYLKASNTGANDGFGSGVAVSGNTLVVGAPAESSNATGVNGDQGNNSANASGAAYVFTRSGTTWSQQAYLKASNTGAGDFFGVSVAVSGDTVVVGAQLEASNATGVNGDQGNNSANASGAAYVFTRSGTTWSQQAYLKASNTDGGDGFGVSVAVSGDAVVVGAFREASNATGVNGNQGNNSAPASGAAYVFTRSGTTWTQQEYLKASNTGAGDQFGRAVAVSGDTVVIGAQQEDSSATGVNGDQTNNSVLGSGAVYVFAVPPTLGTYPATTVDLSGNVTVTPSAAPTDTTSISVAAPTSFLGELTADPVTGVVRITNAHLAKIPAGAYPVTVTAFGPGGTTTATFNLTVTTTACAFTSGFRSAPNVSVGSSAYSVAVGDFNGDGKQDIAATNSFGSQTFVGVRLGDGMGGFSGTTNVSVGDFSISAVAVGDFNGDGKQDIAATSYGLDMVAIRLGDGLGGFSGTTDVAVGSGPRSVVVGDFNGDGRQDIAAANSNSNTVSIRLGDGLGGFSGTTNLGVGSNPSSVAVGDFNGDGKQDVAATNGGSNTISIRLGDGLGGFSGTTDVGVGTFPTSVAVGDFNGDGRQDIATANANSNTVSIRLGNGAGGFGGTTNVGVGTFPTSVAVGDFNGDGNQDIATANFSNVATNTVSIRLGDGAGGLSGTTDIGAGNRPYSVAIGDFNGDGRQDFAAGHSFGFAIRLGTCTPPAVAINNVTHNEGNAGTTAYTFNVSLNELPAPGAPITMDYSTVDGDAKDGVPPNDQVTEDNDYQAKSGTLTFTSNGPLVQTVTVLANGDTTFEPNESFFLVLSDPVNATIAPGGGVGLVLNDDFPPGYTVSDVTAAEGNTGITPFTFTISRGGNETAVASTVTYSTTAVTAVAPDDYASITGGTVTFAPGETTKTATVAVVGDPFVEATETFTLNIKSVTNGTITDGSGTGTIVNDDGGVGGLEGDIVDPNGNAAGGDGVKANDVTVISQKVLFPTTTPAFATTPNQFQRSDVNEPCGNGGSDAGDVTVISQWALGIGTPPPACGPTAPIASLAEEASRPSGPGRTIRAVSTNGVAGQTATVPIVLVSQGNEASTSFTLTFPQATLSNPQVALGNGVPSGTTFGLNSSQVANGRLGVLVATGNTYAAGTRQMITVTFNIAAGATPGNYPVGFSNTPVGQNVSAGQGGGLFTDVTWEAGNVVLGVTAAGVEVSGRVTTPDGRGLRNATVTITDSEGNQRTAITGSFGTYRFEDVEAGASYVVAVNSRRYRFNSRVVNVTDSLTDVDFVGQE